MIFEGNVVNSENLAQYRQYARSEKDYNDNIKMDDSVSLEALFYEFDLYPDDVKKRFARLVINSYNEPAFSDVHDYGMLHKIVNLAKTEPKAFACIYDESGSGDYTSSKIFRRINSLLDERDKDDKPVISLSNRIFLARALMHSEHCPVHSLVRPDDEPITTLPADKDNVLTNIFEMSKGTSDGYKIIHSNAGINSIEILRKLINNGQLDNYEPKIFSESSISSVMYEQIREKITEGAIDWSLDRFAKLDTKFFIEDKKASLLTAYVKQIERKSYYAPTNEEKENFKQTMSQACEKAENLIVQYAKKHIPSKDYNRNGENKTVSRQVEELCDKLWTAGQVEASTTMLTVQKRAYMQAIHEDVMNRNADKLSDNAIRALLLNDKDAFWLRKINKLQPEVAKSMVEKYDRLIPREVNDVLNYVVNPEESLRKNPDISVPSGNTLTQSEKERFMRIKVRYSEEQLETEAPKKQDEIERLSIAQKESEAMNAEFEKCKNTMSLLNQLSDAYRDILNFTKKDNNNDSPHGAEANLAKDKVEEILKDYPDKVLTLDTPTQKVPLLFGAKEKERIEALNTAIGRFNGTLFDNQQLAKESYIGDFRGHMLDEESKKAIEKRLKELNDRSSAFSAIYPQGTFDNIEKNKREIDVMRERLVRAKLENDYVKEDASKKFQRKNRQYSYTKNKTVKKPSVRS